MWGNKCISFVYWNKSIHTVKSIKHIFQQILVHKQKQKRHARHALINNIFEIRFLSASEFKIYTLDGCFSMTPASGSTFIECSYMRSCILVIRKDFKVVFTFVGPFCGLTLDHSCFSPYSHALSPSCSKCRTLSHVSSIICLPNLFPWQHILNRMCRHSRTCSGHLFLVVDTVRLVHMVEEKGCNANLTQEDVTAQRQTGAEGDTYPADVKLKFASSE